MEILKTALIILLPLAGAVGLVLLGVYIRFIRLVSPPTPVTVLSANVGNANITRLLDAFKLHDNDIPVLRRNLAELDPDIVMLQELGDERQAAMILDPRRYSFHFEEKTLTAVNRRKFSKLRSVSSFLPTEGYSICSARLDREMTRIVILNVHTAAPIRDNFFLRRSAQIGEILAEIKEHALQDGLVIAAGDFNFDPRRHESLRKFFVEQETELDRARIIWFDTLEVKRPGGIYEVGGEDVTWHYKVATTLDHVITNLEHTSFHVLDSEEDRIDVDRSFDLDVGNERFMDHRAVLCTLQVNQPEKLRFWKYLKLKIPSLMEIN